MNVVNIGIESLRPAPWASVYVLKPDYVCLERSLIDYGWIQPIVVQAKTNTIIDGNARVELVAKTFDVRKPNWASVPSVVVDCDDLEAMLMHLRLNRSRGQIVAKKMSGIIKDLLRSRKFSEQDLKRLLVMKGDEMDLMVDGSLIKMRKVPGHQYSKAWVPIEAPAGVKNPSADIERPPNPDR